MGVRVDGLSRRGTPHAAARLPRRRCGNMRARRIHQVVVGLVLVVQMLDDLRIAVDDTAAPARQRGQAAGERLQIGGVGLVSEEHELLLRAHVPIGVGAAHVLQHRLHLRAESTCGVIQVPCVPAANGLLRPCGQSRGSLLQRRARALSKRRGGKAHGMQRRSAEPEAPGGGRCRLLPAAAPSCRIGAGCLSAARGARRARSHRPQGSELAPRSACLPMATPSRLCEGLWSWASKRCTQRSPCTARPYHRIWCTRPRLRA